MKVLLDESALLRPPGPGEDARKVLQAQPQAQEWMREFGGGW